MEKLLICAIGVVLAVVGWLVGVWLTGVPHE